MSAKIELHRPTKIAEVPKDRVLALFDLDGTMTKPGSELLLQKFIQEREVGSSIIRRKLLDRFEEWAEARRHGTPNYEQYLTDTGDLWAKLPARGERPLSRPEMLSATKDWFQQRGEKQIMDYSREVIALMKERKIRPVMVTGAPFEIASHFAQELGIGDLFAMEAEVDEQERYTGDIKHNTGLGRTKAKICEQLQDAEHKILFAMGDTHSDMVLMRAAIEFNGRHDGRGRAVMINPRAETLKGLGEWAVDYLSNDKILVIEQHKAKNAVLRRIRHLVNDILEENQIDDGRIEQVA